VQRAEDLGVVWRADASGAGARLTAVLNEYTLEVARTKAPSTARGEAFTILLFGRFLDDRKLGTARLDALSRSLLVDFHGWLAGGGLKGSRSVETCNKSVQRIYRAWEWASTHDDHEKYTPRPKKPALPVAPRPMTYAPRWHEADACLAHATGWQQVALTIARFTGLRPAQVMALEWHHFDLDELLMAVTTGKSRREKEGRVVPISPHLGAYLATLGRREGYVIETGREDPADRVFRCRDAVRAWKLSGVRPEAWKGQTSKAFRKCFQSELKRSGADDEAVKRLVGHSPGLRGVYVEADALPLREAVALIPPVGAVRQVGGQYVAAAGKKTR
jgi:integrase